ncbi:MAG: type I-E CRISPR-associated protein Cas5/CasD [Deltaproteobacteria bacterium]|nr:type I-E CRISPR-associated protein Cas5/CasD [Deltaproteobacteria bacterium]
MGNVLLLRFDAPLVSFGAPTVDQFGVIQPFPALSMLTGLLANALGWDHREFGRLDALQERIQYASRADVLGTRITDYQTANLAQDFMSEAWTTWGRPVVRDKRHETAERFRDYWADSVHTVALTLTGGGGPSTPEVADAIRYPARPLFLGRKCCLPGGPIIVGKATGHLLAALASVPMPKRSGAGWPVPAWWFDGAEGAPEPNEIVPVTDERDWRNHVHVGRRMMRHGMLKQPAAS